MPEYLRGFLIDSARCLEKRSYYRKLIVEAAARGMNAIVWHFTDDQGCTLRFDAAPEIASPHAYTKRQMKALVAFAKVHGVTLIPELESLGHSRYLTNHPRFRHLLETEEEFTAICPVAPETRQIMTTLLREVAEVFDSPYIHVGLDEVKLGGHPLTREALGKMTERELFADYVNFLHREVTKLGRRMIIWGDHRTRTMDFLPLVPRDIIIADWEYSREVKPDQVAHFLSLGFDVLLCPALITYDQPFLAGTQLGLANVRSMSGHQSLPATGGRIVGITTTIWTPTRYLHEAQWHTIALAADLMRDAEANLSAATGDFLREFHGVSVPPAALCHALVQILDLAPLREPYLSLLRGTPIDTATRDALVESQRGLEDSLKTLRTHRTLVKRHKREYETLTLAVRFLVFLHARALQGDPQVKAAQRFLSRLEDEWDHERYADDPRKSSTRFSFDRKEHLLLSFRDSLEVGGWEK
jgi:hypothetical protein